MIMKKIILLMILFLFVILIINVMPGLASSFSSNDVPITNTLNEPKKLPTPTGLRWSDEIYGIMLFDVIIDYNVQYYMDFDLMIYKDNELYRSLTERVWLSFINSENTTTIEIPFYYFIYHSGSYTFTVQALGDNINNSDSDISEISPAYAYIKSVLQLSVPTGLKWSDENPFVATWDPVENAVTYGVHLFKDSEWIGGAWNMKNSYTDFRDALGGPGIYTFRVAAFSSYVENYWDGEFSEISSEILLKIGDINRDDNVDINDVLILLNSHSFNEYAWRLDLNNDRFVDIDDLTLLIDTSNYNN